jgi:uncharacterized protein
LAAKGDFVLVLSPEIIAETWRKLLTSNRLRARYRYTDERAHSFAKSLLRISEVIRDAPPLTGIVHDPEDDMVVACAAAGRADYIVTRDKDLLSIESYQGIAMLEPEEFRALLRGGTDI